MGETMTKKQTGTINISTYNYGDLYFAVGFSENGKIVRIALPQKSLDEAIKLLESDIKKEKLNYIYENIEKIKKNVFTFFRKEIEILKQNKKNIINVLKRTYALRNAYIHK